MIVFSSVSKQFLPDTYALKDISFEVGSGEFVLLTGPSGSGKTTIMRLLTKEHPPTSGKIVFQNTDLNEVQKSKIHEHRRKIGVVFQDYKLIPELNIWENIALPLSIIGKDESEIEERVTDLLELVSLTDRAFHFPKQLSGGEAQRISIARALSTAPSIIFADEPTGNLDKENSLQITKLLMKINDLGTTVLFATHDHDVIDLLEVQRHISLEKGVLVADTVTQTKKNTEPPQVSQKQEKNRKKEKEESQTEPAQASSGITSEKVEPQKKESEASSQKTPEMQQAEEPIEKQIEQPKKQGFFSLFFRRKQTQTQSVKDEGEQLTLEEPEESTQKEKENGTTVIAAADTQQEEKQAKKDNKVDKKEKKKKNTKKS